MKEGTNSAIFKQRYSIISGIHVEDKNYTNDEVERLKIKVTDFIVSQSTKDIDKYSKKFSSLLWGKDIDKEEIIKYCLTLENTYKDCPFPDDFESVTMKHCKNKKWFALLMNVNNKLYLNVKTDPNYSDILRNTYDYVIPAYHMNKEHWNTIIIDKKVDEDLVKELIEQSYQLTK